MRRAGGPRGAFAARLSRDDRCAGRGGRTRDCWIAALIVGAGAQGRVVLDILRAQGRHENFEFIDDDPRLGGQVVNGVRVTGTVEEAVRRDAEVIVALGDPDLRLRVASRFRRLCNAVHPASVIAPTATLGTGVMVGAMAVVNTNATLGNCTVVNTGAIVEHDCVLADGAAVSPGVQLGGRVRVGPCAFVGTGAIVLARVSIGASAVIAAGAVVTRDVPERTLVRGVPARIVEELPDPVDWRRVL